ncbi:unnamed protein product, partial [Polarella glacialis]
MQLFGVRRDAAAGSSSSAGRARMRRSFLAAATVEKIEAGGMLLVEKTTGRRHWLPWPLLGLAEAPAWQPGSELATLRWRLHCVDPESRPGDYHVGSRNSWRLVALQGQGLFPDAGELRTGVVEVELQVEVGAELSMLLEKQGQISRALQLQLARPLSCCLDHRQGWDKGACVLCGNDVAQTVRKMSTTAFQAGSDRDLFQDCETAEERYAARWGAMVELEAAASAVESNDSRLLFGVFITWEDAEEGIGLKRSGLKRRGHFDVQAQLARSHKLKFRGVLARGGELASSWLCLRASPRRASPDACSWAGHGRVVQSGVAFEDPEVALEDEDISRDACSPHSMRVCFELLDESSDSGLPPPEVPFLVEYVPKSLSYSMMHVALSDVNPADRLDGEPTAALLARDVVLGRLQLDGGEDAGDLASWRLNESQELGIRKALARPLMLIHGPPGTGKTRTAAVLMTVFAQRNLGARNAILFGAPTNRAVDCALLYTNELCELHFAERLRARVEEDGDAECAICLEEKPDIVTACGHVFHKACVARSLLESGQCPMCRQVLKQPRGGLRMLRVYGADTERQDFPVPRRLDHQGVQTFKVQTVPENMRRFSWHWRCHAAVEGEEPSQEAQECGKAYRRLTSCDHKASDFDERRSAYYVALKKSRAAEVRQADIIFSTCVSARRTALVEALSQKDAPEVRQVVMDEAGQSPEPEALCLLALARSARHVVLFGDHRQLRPILRSKTAEQAGLGISLFERLATSFESSSSETAPVALLAQQYRMHPDISRFPSDRFYGGKVADHPSVLERGEGVLALPGETSRNTPLLVWDAGDEHGSSAEQLQRVRTVGAGGVGSRANPGEAARAAALAGALAREVGQGAVAVLSWYNSQVAKVGELLRRDGFSGVHMGSIATAQGSEWDYVLLSSVRTGCSDGRLGLLSDPHTMNVALTRARIGLVILCDRATLKQDPHWAVLLRACEKRGVVVRKQPLVRRGVCQRQSVATLSTQSSHFSGVAPQHALPNNNSSNSSNNNNPSDNNNKNNNNTNSNNNSDNNNTSNTTNNNSSFSSSRSRGSSFLPSVETAAAVLAREFRAAAADYNNTSNSNNHNNNSNNLSDIRREEEQLAAVLTTALAATRQEMMKQQEEAERLVRQHRAGLGKCACGSFGNPAKGGQCNACAVSRGRVLGEGQHFTRTSLPSGLAVPTLTSMLRGANASASSSSLAATEHALHLLASNNNSQTATCPPGDLVYFSATGDRIPPPAPAERGRSRSQRLRSVA